jgi:arsenite methyltransferase
VKKEEIKKVVREGYAEIAERKSPCCAPSNPCCGGTGLAVTVSKAIGYTKAELSSVPEGANLGLGCGNPVALASLAEGETVLDLGSGAGFDCFLAANRVGEKGKVIGVDMTPEMIGEARKNAEKGNYKNVDFRLGEIENLPVADNSMDVVISNCVINLSPDKLRVFQEAFRVLKPGGRLMVSDMVLIKELPDFIRDSVAAYVGCISGAIKKGSYINIIKKAGFQKVRILDEAVYPIECTSDDRPAEAIINKISLTTERIKSIAIPVVSIKVQGIKPT